MIVNTRIIYTLSRWKKKSEKVEKTLNNSNRDRGPQNKKREMKMSSKTIPDRWLDYKPIGTIIEGTRFIAFKVPLPKFPQHKVRKEYRLDDRILLEAVPNLGLIIDLTNTKRYYNPQHFKEKGIEYQKLNTVGHYVPSAERVTKFKLMAMSFLNENSNNDKLIGVHCTHGVNRSGYFICNFLISEMSMAPEEAIRRFAVARGHKIERKNYINHLYQIGGQGKREAEDIRNNNEEPTSYENRFNARENINSSYPPPMPPIQYSNEMYGERQHHSNYRGVNTYEQNGGYSNREQQYRPNPPQYRNNSFQYNDRISNNEDIPRHQYSRNNYGKQQSKSKINNYRGENTTNYNHRRNNASSYSTAYRNYSNNWRNANAQQTTSDNYYAMDNNEEYNNYGYQSTANGTDYSTYNSGQYHSKTINNKSNFDAKWYNKYHYQRK